MPGVGVGGLFSNLFNPGLDDRLAQHVTPNPNPLAQQGGPVDPKAVDSLGNPVPAQQPNVGNLAPAAVTQPDPVNSSYAADLLKAHRQDQLSADFNRNIEGVAAGFGTAQQQASKQAALRAGGSGVGDSLAALKDIQGMQDQTIQDNEHARFMGSAATFAQTLSQSLGRPVSIQEAQTIQNSPDLMKSFSTAVGANAQSPDKLKEADAEARDWAAANPNATPAEIAQHKSDFLQQTAGGLSTVGKQLAEDRRNWMNAHKGASFADMIADKPELADETTYVSMKGEKAKQLVQSGLDKLQAKTSFSSVDPQWQSIESNIDYLNDPKNRAAVLAALRAPDWETTNQGGRFANWLHAVDGPTLEAKRRLDWLKNEGFTQEFKGTKNVRSNTEANKLGATFSSLFSPTITDEGANTELTRLANQVHNGRANILAAAGQAIPSKYSDADIDPDYLDPKSPLFNGATRQYDTPSQAQVDKLKANPDKAADFDRMFGPGSSKRFLGQ